MARQPKVGSTRKLSMAQRDGRRALSVVCHLFFVMLGVHYLLCSLHCISEMDCKAPESKALRVGTIHKLVQQLPKPNFEILDILIAHLQRYGFSLRDIFIIKCLKYQVFILTGHNSILDWKLR